MSSKETISPKNPRKKVFSLVAEVTTRAPGTEKRGQASSRGLREQSNQFSRLISEAMGSAKRRRSQRWSL
jgi:hypothetical protein